MESKLSNARKSSGKKLEAQPTRSTTRKPTKKAQPARKVRPSDSKSTKRASANPSSKTGAILAALQRDEGASINELMAIAGWQAHSVRGFLSGTVRKKMGLTLSSAQAEGGRRYRWR